MLRTRVVKSLLLLAVLLPAVAQAQPATTTAPGTMLTLPLTLYKGATTNTHPAWTTSGVRFANPSTTFQDTTSSGTVATAYTDLFNGGTITATSATIFTNYYGTYFVAPTASTNVTMASKYALGADSINATTFAIGGTQQTFPGSALIVGTTDSQTLTNKTLTSPTINAGAISGTFTGNATFSGNLTLSGTDNFTGTFQVGGTAQTFPGSGLLVGTTDSQTLSGKTLTSPTINSGALSGTFTGNATLSGNLTLSGSVLFTGAAATLSGNGQATIGGSSTFGAVLGGQGSSNDVSVVNKNGTTTCDVVTGTTIWQCTQEQALAQVINTKNNAGTNYNIATSDCGKVVLATGAFGQYTLGAASGFSAGCIITLKNGSTTRAQELSGSWPDPRPLGYCGGWCLGPSQTEAAMSDGTSWHLLNLTPISYLLNISDFPLVNGRVTFYVGCNASGAPNQTCNNSVTCSDSNDGLSTSSYLCTLQQAASMAQAFYGIYDSTIRLNNGPSGSSPNTFNGGLEVSGNVRIIVIPTPTATFTGSVTGSVLTVTAVASGTINVGDYLSEPGSPIPAGYYVFSDGTGSGGTGTYNIGYFGSITALPSNVTSQTISSYTIQNTRIFAPVNSFALSAADYGVMFPIDLTFQCTASGSFGLHARQFGVLETENIEEAGCNSGGDAFQAEQGGHVNIIAGIVLAGQTSSPGAIFHALGPGAQITNSQNSHTISCLSTLSPFTWAIAGDLAQIYLPGEAFTTGGCGNSGTAGKPYAITGGGVINTAGGGGNYFPGSTAGTGGTTAGGGYYE